MTRNKHDQYFSSDWTMDALLKFCPYIPDLPTFYVEPSNGEGVLSKAFRKETHCSMLTMDIDASLNPDKVLDFYSKEADLFWGNRQASEHTIITNPPYLAISPEGTKHRSADFAKLALKRADRVALYLRSSFAEPCHDRAELLKNYLTDVISTPRQSFTGDGKTDSSTCSWFVFDSHKKCSTPTHFHVYSKADVWDFYARQKLATKHDRKLENYPQHLEALTGIKASRWEVDESYCAGYEVTGIFRSAKMNIEATTYDGSDDAPSQTFFYLS